MVYLDVHGPVEADTLLDKKLDELIRSGKSAALSGDEVASSSEATADLFSSRYYPAQLHGRDLGGDTPDGVNIRFAPR
jgi:hypothetical protein